AYTTSDVLSPIYNKINPVRQERPFAGKMEQSSAPERPSTVEENLPFAREGSRSFGNLGLLKQERRENKEVVAQPSEDWSSAAPLQADGQSVAGQTTEEHTYIADSVDIGGLAAEEVQQEKREQAGQEPATEWNEAVQSEAEMAIVWNKADGLLVEPALVAADVQPVAEAQQSVNDDESQISEESTWDGAAAGYDTAYGPVAVLQEATPLQTAAGHSHEAETVVPTGHPLPESASQEHSPLEPIPMTTGTAESTATSAEVKRTTFSFAHEQHAFTNENNAYNNPTVDLLNPSPVLTENY
ncbi:hypothetical protein MXD81_55185, partial [Microbacteriaceae bacterium K1510]|nr:hypothetical protein [Microbacteriaceae bacterium K1510]